MLAHRHCRAARMSFAADQLVALLDRHDALDLRPGGQCLERFMRALVTDGADDGASDATNDVGTVTELADFLQHLALLCLRNSGSKDDNHNSVGWMVAKNHRRR